MLLKMVNFICIVQQLKTKRSQGPVRQILDPFLRKKGAEEGDMCIWPFLFICLSHLVIKNVCHVCPALDAFSEFMFSVGVFPSTTRDLFTSCLFIRKTSVGS